MLSPKSLENQDLPYGRTKKVEEIEMEKLQA